MNIFLAISHANAGVVLYRTRPRFWQASLLIVEEDVFVLAVAPIPVGSLLVGEDVAVREILPDFHRPGRVPAQGEPELLLEFHVRVAGLDEGVELTVVMVEVVEFVVESRISLRRELIYGGEVFAIAFGHVEHVTGVGGWRGVCVERWGVHCKDGWCGSLVQISWVVWETRPRDVECE